MISNWRVYCYMCKTGFLVLMSTWKRKPTGHKKKSMYVSVHNQYVLTFTSICQSRIYRQASSNFQFLTFIRGVCTMFCTIMGYVHFLLFFFLQPLHLQWCPGKLLATSTQWSSLMSVLKMPCPEVLKVVNAQAPAAVLLRGRRPPLSVSHFVSWALKQHCT